MSNSQFCIQQRQQEQQKIKRLLVLGFTSSALLHGILAWAIPQWSLESPKVVEPMELIIVDRPKPEPKIESKPIVEPEPKPLPKPEPIKAQTPPPAVKPPEPVKAQTAPPKPTPIPQKVLTTPTPAPSQPIVSAPIENTASMPSLSNSLSAPTNQITSSESGSNPGVPGRVTASNSAPPRPESSGSEGISCISNCEPEYPATLAGTEGNAGVQLTIDAEGNVIGAELTTANSNSQVNRQALLAAKQMKFSSPANGNNASVQVKIEFTVAGSEYDRVAREEQERREQEQLEQIKQETARQQQLDQERQVRQQQLERERQTRQQQLEQPPKTQPQPVPNSQTAPKPSPTPMKNEVDDEMLQRFRQRIEQHQQE
ncbi:MAG: TonB family protein [Pleurocapsa sp.]